MNFDNLPTSILFFAVVYLVSVYGLLTLAQIHKQDDSIPQNSEKTNNQVEIT